MRGFTSAEFPRNGFPINHSNPDSPDANTLERVEVLRGPEALTTEVFNTSNTAGLIQRLLQTRCRDVINQFARYHADRLGRLMQGCVITGGAG